MSENTEIAMGEMATSQGAPIKMEDQFEAFHVRAPESAGGMLSDGDYDFMEGLLGTDDFGMIREPDLIIAPENTPYIYRWYILRDRKLASIYLHVQVADDPERPLHDHPWDNSSVIISGGYQEICGRVTGNRVKQTWVETLGPGSIKVRLASDPHRLLLGKGVDYSISLFTTGPKLREWGFWTDDGWVSHEKYGVTIEEGVSKTNG